MKTLSVRLVIINLIFINSLHGMEDDTFTAIAARNAYKVLKGHTKEVKSVTFNPQNNTQLASASLDKTVRLWDVQTGQCLAKKTLDNQAWGVHYNYDATGIAALQSAPITNEQPGMYYMLSSTDLSELLNLEINLEVFSMISHQNNLAFGCEAGYMVLTTFEQKSGAIQLNNPRNNGTSIQNGVWSLAFSPDGKNLATGTFEKIYIWNDLNQDPKEPAQTLNDNNNNDIVKALEYKDDTTLISGSSTTLKLWDMRQQKPVGILQSSGEITSIAYAHNNQHVANGVKSPDSSTAANGSTAIWDLKTNKIYTTLKHDDSIVASIAYSPDETQLACGQTNGNITVWNLDKTTT